MATTERPDGDGAGHAPQAAAGGPDATPEGPAPLELAPDERELVTEELDAFVPALEDGPRRARYEALRRTVADGAVPPDLLDALGSVLELALETGRARKLYTAEGEKALTALFRRTPAGRDLSAHLAKVNEALASVAGHRLEGASVRMRTLGHFTVTLDTDGPTLTLAVRPDRVEVEKVAVGG